MGILDSAKMLRQAMQAKKKMSQIKGVGQAGIIKGIIIDGLYTVSALEVNKDELTSRLSKFGSTESLINEVSRLIEQDTKAAMADAKKHLEKQMASATSLDDLRSMLSN